MKRTALLVLFLSSTAHAGSNEITFGSVGRSLRSDSANAVTAENLGGTQLAIARELPFAILPELSLWATGRWEYAEATGFMFQSLDTETTSHLLTLGGSARYALHPHLAVTARLDLGTQRTSLELDDRGKTVSDASWGGVATGGVGIDVLALARKAFSFGIRFELGYVAATAPELSPTGPTDDDMLELETAQASIGHLDLSGRFVSFALLARF